MEEAAEVPTDITLVGSPRSVLKAGTRQGLLANQEPGVICQVRSKNLSFLHIHPTYLVGIWPWASGTPSPPATGPSPLVPLGAHCHGVSFQPLWPFWLKRVELASTTLSLDH